MISARRSSLALLATTRRFFGASASMRVDERKTDAGELRWEQKRSVEKTRAAKRPIELAAPGVYRYPDGKLYRVAAAAIVERLPIIVGDPEPWEAEALALKWEHERRTSRDVGERVLDKAQQAGVGAKQSGAAKKASEGKKPSLEQIDAAVRENDVSHDELVKFRPASRTTRADELNDTKSLERKLAESLFLVVKKPRGMFNWQFPQGGYEEAHDKQNLRLTAARELREECGEMRVFFYGNQPLFHVEYMFDAAGQRESKADGAKIFFFPALYMSGDVKLAASELVDHAWLTKDELCAIVPQQIREHASKLLS